MQDYFEDIMEFVIDLEMDEDESVCSDIQDIDYEIEEAVCM